VEVAVEEGFVVELVQIFNHVLFEDRDTIDLKDGLEAGRIVVDEHFDSRMSIECQNGAMRRKRQIVGEKSFKKADHASM